MLLAATMLLWGQTPPPEDPMQKFAEDRTGVCLGPAGDLSKPIEFGAAGRTYRLHGHRLEQTSAGDGKLVVGVISAIKDDREPTLEAVRTLGKQLKDAGAEVIVANGDLAEDEIAMEGVFDALAGLEVLVIVSVGNTESCGSFNRMAGRTFEKKRNFINGNWVRRIELDGGTLVTLPGYYDKRFFHRAGVPIYSQKDVDALSDLAKAGQNPVVLVSHGPPKMSGKAGIDIATEAGHVGDPAMRAAIEKLHISFGIFGHILESGGRGTDIDGQQARAPSTWHSSLYVNAGTANPDPWTLTDGKTAYGMGLLFEVEGNKGKYQVFRLPAPKN